tara:strand:- start:845 stop:1021 length:177 start_codon:yes stop_codon:yes gene_type:complete
MTKAVKIGHAFMIHNGTMIPIRREVQKIHFTKDTVKSEKQIDTDNTEKKNSKDELKKS